MPWNIIEKALKELVPEATDNQITDQMEDIGFYIEPGFPFGTPRLKPKWPGNRLSFCGVFYKKDEMLVREIEKRLTAFYTEYMSNFIIVVQRAIQELEKWRMPVEALYLNEKRWGLVPNNFLGIPCHFSNLKVEFVANFSCGRLAQLVFNQL